ncbi:MAG TPA: FAD/NAD(P)-binding protein [Thermoanaerobaculia bacterium]|nr:FAD/NAD(P)-binding protein [Thermoanaerobaculia bacterium]
MPPVSCDVAVIGAGASGVLTALHLRHAAPELRVALLDSGARAARGLAYGTPYGAHLLNVPAARMSAFVDAPDHFTEWLARRLPGASGKTYAPRPVYGEYLAEVLDEVDGITRVAGTAVGIMREHDRWRVHLHDGRIVDSGAVILALGNLPPADPLHLGDTIPQNYLRDPWAPGAAQGLAADAPIAIIGTGLTMIDLVLALRDEGHRGRVHAISRRGLVPRAHAPHLPRPFAAPPSGSPRELLRFVRSEIAEGHEWRAVIDALRPHTQRIWQSWSLAQRRMFFRHLRVLWDVHRHRAAPEVAAQIEALRADGTLTMHRGRIVSIRDAGHGAEVRWSSADGAIHELQVARVINCTGPASDYATLDLPLVAQLRRAGWLVPDALRLGVETDAEGRMLGSDGEPVPGLFTIGPLRRPALWESTAIPEIRAQAAALAELIGGANRGATSCARI